MPLPQIAENIIELVGRTPMLHLRRIMPPRAADVYAKLKFNPVRMFKHYHPDQ